MGMKWYLMDVKCGFDLHFPNVSDVEHLFICLLAICISSLGRCLFKSLAHVLIRLLGTLLLIYKSSLYIMDLNLFFRLRKLN